jgi:2-aminoadipate transaminase
VIVEDPTYFVYLGILQSHGIKARTVRLQEDGIDLEHLKSVLDQLRITGEIKRLKLLYLVTYYQNPTGINTCFQKKAAALKLLRKYEKASGHPIYLLEDAAYRELRFEGVDEKSLLTANGGKDRVIYAGTYSKPFASGVRIGFGFLPEPLRTAVVRIKGNHDFGSANLLQQILSGALGSDVYEKHTIRLRARYARKAAVMLKAIREHFPEEVEYMIPQGGLYFWARLPKHMKCGEGTKFFKACIENDVLYVPGSLCHAEDPARRKPDNTMRISFGGSRLENIPAGIERLGKVIRAEM